VKAEIFRVDTRRENLLTCFGNSLTLPHQKETLDGPTTAATATETQADLALLSDTFNKCASHKIIQHEGICEKAGFRPTVHLLPPPRPIHVTS
jgi:hypothetical protein